MKRWAGFFWVLLFCIHAQAETPRQVLALRGLWYDLYQCDTAFAALGGARIVNIWHSPQGISGPFPSTGKEMARFDLVVIANINGASLKPEQKARIKEFVEQGGAVLMLGGYYAFGAEYHGTELEEIAPVEFSAGRDLVSVPNGELISPAKAGAQPRIYWRHDVRPKPSSSVVLSANGQPLLITGKFGKGRVAVFSGSVMGHPPAGQLPFWEWPQWRDVLAETIAWLSPTAKPVSGKAEVLAQLQAATNGATAVDQLFEAALPVADRDLAPAAKALIATGKPAGITLGLRLLGLSQAIGAKEQLLAAFEKGLTALQTKPKESSLDELLEDTGSRKKPVIDPEMNPVATGAAAEQLKAIKLAALDGLGWLGDPSVVDFLREVAGKNPSRSLAAGEFMDSFTDSDEMRGAALVAALKCGDANAAPQVVEAWLQNVYTLTGMKITSAGAKTKKNDTDAQIARLTLAQERLTAALQRLPLKVLPALAQKVAEEEDAWVMPLAFAAFGRAFNDRALSPEVAKILQKAKLPAVASLAIQTHKLN